MGIDVFDPTDDKRVTHCKATLNGIIYREIDHSVVLISIKISKSFLDYLLGVPPRGFQRTIFLVGSFVCKTPAEHFVDSKKDTRLARFINWVSMYGN